MEDLKQRLKFDDIAVRSRCLQKLVQAVKKKSKGQIITSSSVQIPELNLIWETCANESSSTSNLAVRGIIYLVVNHYIDVNHALTRLLSYLSSASNAHGVVKGITRLLTHQSAHLSEGSKSFCYSLYQPKHPLISVLEINDDYLPLILECIADTISEDNLRGFQVMEPVICYILSNPVTKKNDCSKVLLLETLIETVKLEPKTAFYILRCIPFLQVDDYHQVVEVSHFILKAKRAFASFQCEENDRIYISELLLLSALSLSERSIMFGHDPTRLLHVTIEVGTYLSKIDYSSSYVNMCLVMIAVILKRASDIIIDKYVMLASILVDFQGVSPTVVALLAFSVIQVMPEPSLVSFDEKPSSTLPRLLEKLEHRFLNCQTLEHPTSQAISGAGVNESAPVYEKTESDNIYIEAFTSTVSSALQCSRFALKLDESQLEFKLGWLESIKSIMKGCSNENLDTIFSLVAALFLMFPDEPRYLSSCLDTFEVILSTNTFMSAKVFALLLYKQNLVKSPECKFQILEFLPKSATHKFAIPPVLSILKMMSTDVELKSQAIHLMLQLWKRNDRCFSYLHKLLLESHKSIKNELGINEILISQAAAIREVCLIAPEKHGKEFLGTLSKLFNESTDEASSPAACLALDGVISLCKSEITDLRSTWKILGPNLSKDRRILVTCRMYKLLSLVPELQVKSSEYDTFINEIVGNIWKRLSSGSMPPEAVSAAYKALSKFSLDNYNLKQLPSAAKTNLQLPVSMKATPFEMGKSPEDVLTYIPGYCFIDLLKSFDNNVIIEGYTEFLNAIIQQEVSNLPRSAYSQKKYLQKRNDICGTLAKVPAFLCVQFEKGKSPTLQKNIAAGVLFSYEPPLEYGKDNEPLKRSLACQYRLYEQVLGAMLNDVNIDTTEWQRCILLPLAWQGFMERAFIACEESRRAELELQNNLGHIDVTSEDFEIRSKCAWLWVRDRLLNVIKTNVKNAATSQANAMFSIFGLVYALNKFYSSLDDDSKTLANDDESFVRHQVFVEECTETILCSLMPNYKKTGSVHSWLLTHLSRPKSSSCTLVMGCSYASLFNLSPILVSSHPEVIPLLFQNLLDNLSHNSPVMNFYSGLGLGLFMRSLCDIGYGDVGESQLDLLLKSAKEINKICCKEESPNPSALIALTLAVTSLSSLSDENVNDWVSTTSNLFLEKLREEDTSSMTFEMLSICVSAMTISAVQGSCSSIDSVLNLSSWFEEKQTELPQCSGISVSYGMLIEALERFGHSSGLENKQKIQKIWFSTLTSEDKHTLHRIAALNGLCSLYSCGRGFLQVKFKEKDVGKSAINDLISLMFQMLNAGRDTGLQSICSWEVGRLYSVCSFQQESDASVPSSYSYLNEKSILKYLVKLLIGSQNPEETRVSPPHLVAALKAMSGTLQRPFPPLNWITVLTPFLQQNEDSVLNEVALSIAINQAKGSPYATNLLSSYCCPPLFHTLPGKSREFLLKNLPVLTVVLPPQKLKIFLHIVISFIIKQETGFQALGDTVMQGLQSAFVQPGIKPQTLGVLQEAFDSLLKHFKKNWDLLQKYLKWIADVFHYLPAKHVESLLSIPKNTDNIPALASILCYLVKTGYKKLSSLRSCIEEGKHVSCSDKERICTAIYQCFVGGGLAENSEVDQPSKCISWLLETMGWINVLNDTKSQYQLMTVGEVFQFLTDVCFATIIGCSGLECSYILVPFQGLSHKVLLENLPHAIAKLSKKEEWKNVTDKLIGWLILLLQSPHVNENDKRFIKFSLCAVGNLNEFKNLNVWTNVMSCIYK